MKAARRQKGGEQMDHLDYLEEMGVTASEWEKTTNAVAQELVAVLRKKGCTYHNAKAALSTASSMLEKAMLKAKV